MARIITAFPVNKPDSSGRWIVEGVVESGHTHLTNIDYRGEHAKSPADHLLNAVNELNPNLVIITKTNVFKTALDKILCKKVMMNVDCRTSVSSWHSISQSIELVDGYFPCEYHLIRSYEKNYGKKVYFLPTACGAVNKRLDIKSASKEDLQKYSADIAFIGSRDPFHGPPRKRLIDAIEKKYGKRFKWFGISSPNGYAGNEEFNKICSYSKIIIGNNYIGGFDSYVSRRDFMVLGSGGFLLTNLYKNTKKIMVPGEHFIPYETVDDCLGKIDKYLQKPDLREKIRSKGYEYAHKECRWRNRIREICHVMELR